RRRTCRGSSAGRRTRACCVPSGSRTSWWSWSAASSNADAPVSGEPAHEHDAERRRHEGEDEGRPPESARLAPEPLARLGRRAGEGGDGGARADDEVVHRREDEDDRHDGELERQRVSERSGEEPAGPEVLPPVAPVAELDGPGHEERDQAGPPDGTEPR